MLIPTLSRVGFTILRELPRGKFTPVCRTGFVFRHYSGHWQPQFELHPEAKTFRRTIFQKHHQFSTTAAGSDAATGSEGKDT